MDRSIVFVKTKYHDEIERVYARLKEGKRKVADVSMPNGMPLFAQMKVGSDLRTYRVRQIGCNSFGIEVFISKRATGEKEWTALEQFSTEEQLRIASCIKWDTLQ